MMQGRKKIGERRLTNKEKKARYNEKNRKDPVKYEERKQKERERWTNRVQSKKVKLIADLSARERRMKRKRWTTAQREVRKRKKMRENLLSPPTSPEAELAADDVIPEPGPSTSKKAESGRKRVLRKRAKTVRDLQKTREALKRSEKRVAKYKVQAMRLKRKFVDAAAETPRKIVDRMMADLKDGRGVQKVRRRLIFQQAFLEGIQQKRTKWKKVAKENLFSLKLVKKYKMASWMRREVGMDVRSMKKCLKVGHKELPGPVKQLVTHFYERDDVSRITASKKSTVTKGKEKKQRRYLLDDIKELHKKYNSIYKNLQISYQAFCRLRPFWVLFPHSEDRETCNCQRCDNLSFMVKKLVQNKVMKSSSLRGLVAESYSLQGSGQVNPRCLTGDCEHNCPKPLSVNEDVDWEKEVSWSSWVNKTVDTQERRDGTGPSLSVRITEKVTKTAPLQTLREDLEEEFDTIGRRHLLNSIHQSATFSDLKAKILQNDIIIHVDFAENYGCKYHEEVQSMHFGASRDQATIHDGVIYVQDQVLPFATISNCLRHDAAAVWTYLHPVMKWITSQYKDINGVHFVSDGPTTQYKNKFNLCLLCTWFQENFPQFQRVTWNFSGAGHGKSPADGVGASIKRSADKFVANGMDIPNAKTLFEVLTKREKSKVQLFYTAADEVEDISDEVPLTLKSISGTMKIHQVIAERGSIKFRPLSCFCSYPNSCDCFGLTRHVFVHNEQEENDESENLEDQVVRVVPSEALVGQWVIVTYGFESRPFPGYVTLYMDDEVYVKVMRQKGQNAFNWPTVEDCIAYQDVVCIIGQPRKSGRNRHYSLAQNDWETYCSFL